MTSTFKLKLPLILKLLLISLSVVNRFLTAGQRDYRQAIQLKMFLSFAAIYFDIARQIVFWFETKTNMFRNPFSFDGRIRRKEYGISLLMYYAFAILIEVIDNAYFSNGIIYLLFIPALWFMFAQGTKRCHDRNNSAWYQFIPFYLFWLLFADGDPEENRYGKDPKGRGNLLDELLPEVLTN